METLETELEFERGATRRRKCGDEETFESLCEKHPWLSRPDKGFMYYIPERSHGAVALEQWKRDWGDVLLDFAEESGTWVLRYREVAQKRPFSNLEDKSYTLLFMEHLVSRNLAVYLGEGAISLKSEGDVKKAVLEWIDRNKMDGRATVAELLAADEPFSLVPAKKFLRLVKSWRRDPRVRLKKEGGIWTLSLAARTPR
ncbi:MAG: hypothetical protein ACTSU5_19555 [Promethearchaeota archaeon]